MPNVYSIGGLIHYEQADGTLSTTDSYEKGEENEAQPPPKRRPTIPPPMHISVDLPDSATSPQASPAYYKQALVAVLYQTGDLSSKEACDALGMPRRVFEEMLPRFGVAVMPDDDESIATELST